MTTHDAGAEQVDVRQLWPNEALDFTPWLANNLDLLGQELGLKLVLVQQEHSVGAFALDILARDSDTGELVAIENQLEWTDHGHLGQLLAYAAGCKASVAIWVAPALRYEHAEALHQLNEWTGGRARFYGVKIEVNDRGDGSPPEPRFRKVVYAHGWNKDITQPLGETTSPENLRYLDFFQPLIDKLHVTHSGFQSSRQAFSFRDRFLRSSFDRDIGYTAALEGGCAWVYVLIRTWDSVDLSNRLFDALKDDQEGIEASIVAQGEWQWDRYDGYTFSTISIRKIGSIDVTPGQLQETREWMLDLLPRFREVFEPRLEKLLGELRQ